MVQNGGFHKWGTPKWLVYRDNPIEMDDFRVPIFQETTIWFFCIEAVYWNGAFIYKVKDDAGVSVWDHSRIFSRWLVGILCSHEQGCSMATFHCWRALGLYFVYCWASHWRYWGTLYHPIGVAWCLRLQMVFPYLPTGIQPKQESRRNMHVVGQYHSTHHFKVKCEVKFFLEDA